MDILIMLVMLMGDQRYLWFSGITLSLELVCLINNYNHIPSIMIILYEVKLRLVCICTTTASMIAQI